MGNIFSWHVQPKELRVIYVQDDKTKRIYPIPWPNTFQNFVEELHELFPKTKLLKPKFLFDDAIEGKVCICSETTYRALVPKHQKIVNVDLYYVGLDKWLID